MVQIITPKSRRKDLFYSDLRKDMFLSPLNSDVSINSDEAAVKESIKNLVLTDRGERLFQPNIGCDIRRSLFENFSPQIKISMERSIRNTILQYEPRCNLISVNAQPTDDDYNILITIIFNIINIPENIELELTLERTR
jgi:phage baseplate assembly protein W